MRPDAASRLGGPPASGACGRGAASRLPEGAVPAAGRLECLKAPHRFTCLMYLRARKPKPKKTAGGAGRADVS